MPQSERTDQNMFGKKQPVNVKIPSGKGAKAAKIIILLLVLAVLAGNSYYSIQEEEQAVVCTFGSPKAVTMPGLHFKVPFIQNVTKVNTTIQGFPIGYRQDEGEDEEDALMITSDYNFIYVDFYAEYRVTDPVKYLYASESPVDILKNLTQSYIRDTIGLYDVDSVITTGKNEIQASIKEKIVSRLESEDIGIQLVNITIQDAEPPTSEVVDAFKNVENAKQGKETSINRANQKRNEDIPAARAQADETMRTAEAQAQERVNEAKGQTARLNELYAEFQKYPLITKQRMFYETMEEILPDMKVIIEKSDGTTQTMLPLESFADFGNGNSADLNARTQESVPAEEASAEEEE